MMKKSKLQTLAVWTAATAAVATAGAAELRGYGKVEAAFQPGVAEFRCESAESAERVRAKLIRDFGGIGAARAAWADGMLKFPDGRTAVIGRRGNAVVVRDGTDRAGLTFPAPKPYPVYLDYFDLRAQKYYDRPMASLLGYGLENHWPFAKKHGIEGLVFHAFALSDTPAPGVVNFTAMDYEMEAARKAGGLVTISLTPGGALPLWLYNEGPENTAKPQDSTVITEWQHGVDSGSYEGYGTGFDPKKSPIRAYQKQVMEHFVKHPNLGGWQLYRGAPIGDQLGRGLNGVLWDASPGAARMFRKFLQKNYTLAQLGERWRGNSAAYRSWEEVGAPQMMDLIGGDYDKGRLLLSDREWEWSKTPEGGYDQPPTAAAKWVKFHFPPSRRLQFLDIDSSYFRLRNVPREWLRGRTGKTLYLKAVCLGYDHHRLQAWVNGKFLKSPSLRSHNAKLTGMEIPPGTLRGDGTDEIIFQTPFKSRGDGRIHGPISLSEQPAENFPYADKRLNARYMDLYNFETDALLRRNLDMFRYARHLDPDRPMSLSGASWDLMGKMLPFFSRYGIGMQSTSIDAFYWPQLADWGRLYGFYFIGEPSQPLNAENFDRVFGQQFYLGTGGTAIFMDIEQYMKIEKETGLMSKRAPLLRHLGHYLVEPPRIAQLCTTQTHNFGTSQMAFGWNFTRGELQSAHYPAALVTEMDLQNGKITPEKFPVLFDCSDIMTEETVTALRRYVEAGGTLIALPGSGQHSDLERNRRVLEPLSGFRAATSGMRGNIRFSADETVFPKWAGKSLPGRGTSNFGAGWSLTPLKLSAQTVAVWPDGSTAVGMRKIGKGKILVLGSDFYRSGRDHRMKMIPNEPPDMLIDLLRQLGISRSATASTPRVWVRRAVTKTGSEEWLVATNVTEQPPLETVANLEFTLGFRPREILDVATGKPVPFTYADGKCKLANLRFERLETRIFAAVRPTGVTEALKVWWQEKLDYWKRGPALDEPDPEPVPSTVLNLDRWQFRPAGATAWREAKPGSWKIQFADLRNYQGNATYRREFTAPESWRGKRVNLTFRGRAAIYDSADFFLNGKKIGALDRARLHPELNGLNAFPVGETLRFNAPNVLEINVKGGTTAIAGIGDNLFLAVEREMRPEISLNGAWACVKADFLNAEPVTVPGRFHGRFLRRSFDVPADWKNRQIFLRLDTPDANISAVVLNDRGKGLNGAYPPFGNRTEINVTEFLKFGEKNTIELWHRHTIPTNYIGLGWRWPKESNLAVDNLVIGPVAK